MTFFRAESNRRALLAQLVWFGAWVAVTGFAIYLHPDGRGHGTHQALGLPPCPSVLIFDRPCPGCGLTTSWTALIHGNIPLAFAAHPLGPILYAIFTAGAWMSLYGWRKGKLLLTDSAGFTRGFAVGFAIFLAFGGIRMALTTHFQNDQERLISQLAQSANPPHRP